MEEASPCPSSASRAFRPGGRSAWELPGQLLQDAFNPHFKDKGDGGVLLGARRSSLLLLRMAGQLKKMQIFADEKFAHMQSSPERGRCDSADEVIVDEA